MEIIKSMEVTKHVKILIAVLIAAVLFGAGVIAWLTMENISDAQSMASTGVPAGFQEGKQGMVTADPSDPSAVGTPVAKSVTQDEVMQHQSPTDCHTIIRGGVYSISSFIEQHPDGKMNFENTCGMDSTKLFEGQYGGIPKEEEQLKSLFVGVYAKE